MGEGHPVGSIFRFETLVHLNKGILLSVGFVFGIVVLELLLRLAGTFTENDPSIQRRLQEIEILYTADELLGWQFRPGARGSYTTLAGTPVEHEITINSYGLRDVEFSMEKLAGTKRIILLGDSFFAALEVPLHSTSQSIIEENLSPDPSVGTRAQVVNMSVQGFATDQQVRWYEARGSEFSPDLVLLAFFIGNDVDDLHPSLMTVPFFHVGERQGHFVVDEQGELRWFEREAENSQGVKVASFEC